MYVELLKQARFLKGHLFSIGIVTAPFKGSKLRGVDMAYTSLGEMIVQDLIEAIQPEFPMATIRLHNSPDSTIIESLSRVVNARKVAICGCSTFCPYALLAREDLGFMYNPVGSQNQWVRNAANWHPYFHLFETPMLNGLVISNNKNGYKMPEHRVIRWLREQDPTVGNIDITESPIFRHRDEEVKRISTTIEKESQYAFDPTAVEENTSEVEAVRRAMGTLKSKPPSYTFDPSTVEGKAFEDVEGLQDDGTYLFLHDEFHHGPGGFCMPMMEVKDKIKRVHYHFAYCKAFGEFIMTLYLVFV